MKSIGSVEREVSSVEQEGGAEGFGCQDIDFGERRRPIGVVRLAR